MTLNPQNRIPDGVTVPYEGQTVDATAAVLARQKLEREAERERLAKLDAKWRPDVDMEAVNPEPVRSRLLAALLASDRSKAQDDRDAW